MDAIIDLIAGGDGDIELVTLGPLTNIALAILQAPEVMKKLLNDHGYQVTSVLTRCDK